MQPGPLECPPCARHKLPADIVPPKLLHVWNRIGKGPDGRQHLGIVCAEGTLTTEGIPVNIVITRHGDRVLERALIAAVQQWRYSPAMKNGEPVEVPLSFSVESR